MSSLILARRPGRHSEEVRAEKCLSLRVGVLCFGVSHPPGIPHRPHGEDGALIPVAFLIRPKKRHGLPNRIASAPQWASDGETRTMSNASTPNGSFFEGNGAVGTSPLQPRPSLHYHRLFSLSLCILSARLSGRNIIALSCRYLF